MCCSEKKIDGINRKREQSCGIQTHHHAEKGCYCTMENNEINDPDTMWHRRDCYSGKGKGKGIQVKDCKDNQRKN